MVDPQKLLLKVINEAAKEHGYTEPEVSLSPRSSGGANFTTQLWEARVRARGRPDLRLFGKVAVFGEDLRKTALFNYYKTEDFFFTKLAKRYEGIQDKHNVTGKDRLTVPKFYGSNSNYMEETFLFEDMRERGFEQYDRFKSATWEYAASVVREMAKLHALSIAYGIEYPDEFEAVLKDLKFSIPAERGAFRALCAGWTRGALEAAAERHRGPLVAFMRRYGDMEETTQFYHPLRRPVIAHGDFKITNLLHRVNNVGEYEVCIVDYQTLRAGSGASDLVHFACTSSAGAFRRAHLARLERHYLTELQAAMTRLHVPGHYFTEEDFRYEMDVVRPFGVTVAVYVLLVLLVEHDAVTPVDDGTDVSSFAMRPSAAYAARLNEILDEYHELGLL